MLAITNLRAGYPAQTVLTDLSLQIAKGELVCLLGPSGCGKSTLLRVIAGFEPTQAGNIVLSGQVVNSAEVHIPSEKRSTGMVFQDFALFPHLRVDENILFGLKNATKSVRNQRLQHLAQLVDIKPLLRRYPHELSGGQQQRVALARALANPPAVLLLDEPFSSLDTSLRLGLGQEVRDILKQECITTLMVTHDQHEAFNFADKIALLAEGRIVQFDTPDGLYTYPKHPLAAEFIGTGCWLNATVTSNAKASTYLGEVTTSGVDNYTTGDPIRIMLRTEHILFDKESETLGCVKERTFKGARVLYTLELSNHAKIMTQLPNHLMFEVGEQIPISLSSAAIASFPR